MSTRCLWRLARRMALTSAPGDAQVGERAEGPVLGPVVAGRLDQGDQRLLLEVVGVAAGHEVGPGPGPGEAAVPGDQLVEGVAGRRPGSGR